MTPRPRRGSGLSEPTGDGAPPGVSYCVRGPAVSPGPVVTDTPPPTDRDEPVDLVDRGPVETLAPSRTAIVLVAVVGLAVAVLAGVGALNVESSNLGEDEALVEEGRHTIDVGPVSLTADIGPGDWVERERCDRWVQLSASGDDATTLHAVWLDAVPLPSTADRVELVPTPDDVPAWWRQQLDLEVTPRPDAGPVDGRPVERYDLDATEQSRRRDGLVACGEVGGLAATGMFGPAARFDQQVALIDVDGTPLLLVAAAYIGGDPDLADQALDRVLDTATLEVSAPAD